METETQQTNRLQLDLTVSLMQSLTIQTVHISWTVSALKLLRGCGDWMLSELAGSDFLRLPLDFCFWPTGLPEDFKKKKN